MKFEQNWLSGFRGGRLKILTDGRTHGLTDSRMGTYLAMHFVAKIIKWLLILSAYYCPSLCVYKLHLATLGMDYLSIAIILLCG